MLLAPTRVTTPLMSFPTLSPSSIQLLVVRPNAWITSKLEMPSRTVNSGEEYRRKDDQMIGRK